MRQDTPSWTAASVAAARGMSAWLPDDARIAHDPYGLAFWPGAPARSLPRWPLPVWAQVPGLSDFVLYMQVRTRLLDDAVRDLVATSPHAQVVLLGAGYDCRALRLPELAGVPVFEVDHPATQGHKGRVLAALGAQWPSRRLAWDFEARPMSQLPGALEAEGLDSSRPTLTIWEGVTMYLSEPAIDASVAAVAAYSGPGSRLAFTYMHRAHLQRPSPLVRAVKALVSQVGEPWTFGWDPAALPAWFAPRGFAITQETSIGDAAHALLPARFARRLDTPMRRFAVAARENIAVAHRAP